MNKYALLDYDGFVCKAFYAASAKKDLSLTWEILNRLTEKALNKTKDYFKSRDVEVILFMSGHTWKKEEFPGYKKSREKNPDLSEFRDEVIFSEKVIKSKCLEADDLINLCCEYLELDGKQDDYIVFSDDKDLHAIAKRYCKINLTEQVVQNKEPRIMLYAQMLAGDKEDDVQGIPKVGLKTAYKLLGSDASIDKVAEIYKEKNIPHLVAYMQILLIKPLSITMNLYPLSGMYVASNILDNRVVDEEMVDDCIKGELHYVHKILYPVYNNGGQYSE